MKYLKFFFLICYLGLLPFAHAEMVDTYAFKNQADRTRAVELAKSLRCPQCQNQNLVESNSPIAYDLRLEVYKMVDEGQTNQQIIDAMTARFGQFVNYKPPFQWNTALLWLAPIVLFGLAFALIWYSMKQPSLNIYSSGTSTLSSSDPRSTQSNYLPEVTSSPALRLKTLLLIFSLLLIVPLAYYFSLDRLERVQQGEQLQVAALNQRLETSEKAQQSDLIETIQNRLRANPNNGDDWRKLAEAYMEAEQYDNALIALRNAAQILGETPELLGLGATAQYYLAGQKITPKIRQLIEAALQENKNEVSSLNLLAAEALAQKNYPVALRYWQQLLDSNNPAVDRRAVIQHIKMVEIFNQ